MAKLRHPSHITGLYDTVAAPGLTLMRMWAFDGGCGPFGGGRVFYSLCVFTCILKPPSDSSAFPSWLSMVVTGTRRLP